MIGSTDHVIPFFDSGRDGCIMIKDRLHIMKCPLRTGCTPGWAVGNDMGHGAVIRPRPA